MVTSPFEGSKPRYLVLAESLANDIKSGKYAVGGLLPTEAELSEQFNVSRHTVREATRKLRDLDLVTRLQGIGTRVKNKDVQERYVLELGSYLDMWKLVEETEPKVLSRRMVWAQDVSAELPALDGNEKWLEVEMIRSKPSAEGAATVISYSRNYINGAYASISDQIEGARVPLFSLVAEAFNKTIVLVRQNVSAVLVDRNEAEILRAEPGTPALWIVRTYYGEGNEVLEVSNVIAPSDRFNFSTDIRIQAASTPQNSGG